MTDDRTPDEQNPGEEQNPPRPNPGEAQQPRHAGGLTPHGVGPDMTPGRHARPEDRTPERAVEQTGPIPTVHSDVWVAPAGERPAQTTGGPQQRPTGAQQPGEQPPHRGPVPGQDTPPSFDKPAPVPAAAASTSMSDILDPHPAAPAGGAVAATATRTPVNRKPSAATGRKRSERRLAYWLIAPAALVMALVTGYPIIYAFWLSLNKATLTAPDESEFVGVDNYVTVLGDGYWWTALAVTVGITLVSVLIELVLGMAIALVMHRALFGRAVIRTVVLIPYGIVTVAAAFSWYYAWTPETGYLANLLPDGSAPLTEQWPSLAIIVLAEVWKTTPFMALLLLAGLALVPDDLLKAAQIDGAGAWTRLWKVILPLMKPAILVALLFRTLDAFRIFDNIYVLTQGTNNTFSVSMLGYDNLFKAFNLGVGSAISILIFLCVALIAFLFIKGFGAAAPGSDDEGR